MATAAPDLFVGELGDPQGLDEHPPAQRIWFNRDGELREQVIDRGLGTHESKAICLDGRVGIVCKPFRSLRGDCASPGGSGQHSPVAAGRTEREHKGSCQWRSFASGQKSSTATCPGVCTRRQPWRTLTGMACPSSSPANSTAPSFAIGVSRAGSGRGMCSERSRPRMSAPVCLMLMAMAGSTL